MPDRAGVDERIRAAGLLSGTRLRSIRYFDIDYRRWTLAPDWRGLREVVDEQEWLDPTWKFPTCDSVDYGLELETDAGRVFSVTWDPPGKVEGLGVDEVPLLGSALKDDANVAVWDVTRQSQWEGFIGREIVGVQPHYRRWEPSGFWCSRITVQFPESVVELLLAEGLPDGLIAPSADNVAVLFAPAELPSWERQEAQ